MNVSEATGQRSARGLFARHAAISLVPVVLIGLLLARSYATDAENRGLAEARAQAKLIATAVIEPQLTGADLRAGVSKDERARLAAVADRTATDGTVLRMRLRDLDGRVVFSPDGSGLTDAPEDEAVEAGEGEEISELTHLNADASDTGPVGPEVVEVYRAVYTHPDEKPVGVLEMYLPYAPIRADVTDGTRTLYRDLAIGLFVLYIVLAALSFTTTRRLRRQSQRNAYLAEHDLLTGLPNRDAFVKRIRELTDANPPRFAAVAIVDLDRFKDVNDTLGHDIGDELLVRVGARLLDAVRPGDVIARLGGDEFGVVLARCTSDQEAASVLARLRQVVAEPISVGDLPLAVEASVGYVIAPEDGEDAQLLLQRADIAMYVAKASRSTVVRYRPDQDTFDADRLAVVGELQRALTNDELVLHYQPKLELSNGEVHAVEALIRWNHPRHGLLQPDAFLPVAEQTGLIDDLTDWVLRAALRQLTAWDADGIAMKVAVNVSARNLTHDTFVERVLAAVRNADVQPDRVILEVTETALFTDFETATAALRRLDDAGLSISLDDFGQGQTSLGYLSRLPVSELKVDRAFVGTMCQDSANAAIVRSVVDLAHNLGLRVVAEGAEDSETVDALRLVGCDTVQGYVISRPMEPSAVAPWIRAHGSALV